jgi:hypothetical protein
LDGAFKLAVCTENSIRVDDVTESPKLTESLRDDFMRHGMKGLFYGIKSLSNEAGVPRFPFVGCPSEVVFPEVRYVSNVVAGA